MASKVYYLNDRASGLPDSIPFKGVRVLRDAGLESMIKPGDKVGIKVHLGEWGNALNLRPHWVSAIADEVKRLGGKPAVVETNVAVYGEALGRCTTEDHLKTAAVHGFTEETMGCPIVICDGDYGVDDVQVPVPNGVYMKYSFIGKGFLDFDKIIVVTHFKGHPMGVFGGSMKNVGIGMSSARGKYAVHNISHPEMGIKTWEINQDAVKGYSQAPHPNIIDRTVSTCPTGAFTYENGILSRDKSKCRQCGYCFARLFQGIYQFPAELVPSWPAGISDAACAYINAIGKDNMIFLNYAMDITPQCDCGNCHDRSMIPNLGVFASRDAVAVDMACIEAAEAVSATPGSVADEYGFGEPNTERFTNCSSMAKISQWAQINASVYNGTGSSEYVLVDSKATPCKDFEFPRYRDITYMEVHKEAYAHITMDPGDYAYSKLPRLDMGEQSKKPKGKVKEISIEDD
ncbi:DUF362 domain-containing protein [Caproiciproducens sp.]